MRLLFFQIFLLLARFVCLIFFFLYSKLYVTASLHFLCDRQTTKISHNKFLITLIFIHLNYYCYFISNEKKEKKNNVSTVL